MSWLAERRLASLVENSPPRGNGPQGALLSFHIPGMGLAPPALEQAHASALHAVSKKYLRGLRCDRGTGCACLFRMSDDHCLDHRWITAMKFYIF
jgi:hypothetical protein